MPYIENNMRVIVQLMSLSPQIEIPLHETRKSLTGPQLRLHIGLKYYFREAQLKYLFSSSSRLGITKEALTMLLHEFRMHPLSTLIFLWFCRVYHFDVEKEVCIKFPIACNDEEIWISRQAILGGIKPFHLDETIDYNFFRNTSRVKIRIWATSNSDTWSNRGEKLPLSQIIELDNRFQFESKQSQPKCVTFRKASIHHGSFITINSQLTPISREQRHPSVSWPTNSFVKSENRSRFYIIKSNKKTYFDEAIFIGDSSSWYHFIIEYLPRYLAIPVAMRNLPTIVSKNIPKQFVELLSLLGFSKLVSTDLMEEIETGQLVSIIDFRFENPFDFTARRKDLLLLQKLFREIEFPENRIQHRKRIFILRPDNLFRRMENTAEVVRKLEQFNFEAIYPERLNFIEQLSIFQSAEIVVGQSGAALTSLIFCDPKVKVFELGDWEERNEQFFWRNFANELELTIKPIYSQPKTFTQNIRGNFKCNVVSLVSELSKLT